MNARLLGVAGAFVLTTFVANTSAPAQASYTAAEPTLYDEEGEAPESAEHQFSWTVGGSAIAMIGAGWIYNAIVSAFAGVHFCLYASCGDGEDWSTFRELGTIPIAGPFLQLAEKPGRLDQDGWAIWLVGDGLVQVAGLVLLVVELARSHAPRDPTPARVELVPSAGDRSAELAIRGRF